uniref:Uncharacterized protein n=1 Tax=Peronospora matthiolae TaxID=2874970 RepID=A0AAV1TKF9_9STRA
MTDRLAASKAKLQADSRKAPLLQKLQQSPVPELDRMKPSASATECQNQTECDDDFARDLAAGDWFDPGGNKKPRKQRKSSNSLRQATAFIDSNNTMLTFSSRLPAAPVLLLERQLQLPRHRPSPVSVLSLFPP